MFYWGEEDAGHVQNAEPVLCVLFEGNIIIVHFKKQRLGVSVQTFTKYVIVIEVIRIALVLAF